MARKANWGHKARKTNEGCSFGTQVWGTPRKVIQELVGGSTRAESTNKPNHEENSRAGAMGAARRAETHCPAPLRSREQEQINQLHRDVGPRQRDPEVVFCPRGFLEAWGTQVLVPPTPPKKHLAKN